jgi:hypothetical protein
VHGINIAENKQKEYDQATGHGHQAIYIKNPN